MTCSARSFSSASSSAATAPSSARGVARAARAGDRPHRDACRSVHAHEQLRRAADELHAVEHEVVHVRRRIDRAQRAIERDRVEKSCGTSMRRASST